MSKKIYLLDPLTGVKNETNFDNLAKITGLSKRRLHHIKCKKSIIQQLGMYIVDADITVKEKTALMNNFKDINEVWREIDYKYFKINIKNKRYFISNLGRCKIIYPSGKERVKVQTKRKNRNRLFTKIVDKEFLVHQLVAKAFLGEKENGQVIYHIDGNSQNNRVENLCYKSRSFVGKKTGGLGNSIPVIKMSLDGEELEYYESMAVAARENYVSKEVISKHIKGGYKTAGGFLWKIDTECLKV